MHWKDRAARIAAAFIIAGLLGLVLASGAVIAVTMTTADRLTAPPAVMASP